MATAYDAVAREGYGQQIADKAQNSTTQIKPNYMSETELRNLYGDPSKINAGYLDQLVQQGRLGYRPGEDAIDPGMDYQPGAYFSKLEDGRYMDINKVGDNWILGDPRAPSGGGVGSFLRNFVLPAAGMGILSTLGVGQGVASGINADIAAAEAGSIAAAGGGGAVPAAAGAVGAGVGNAAGGAAAAGGIGSALSNPGVIAAALGTAGNAYVADQAGGVLRDSYERDRAWQDEALNRLRASYDDPSAYLQGDQYQAAQRVVHNQLQRRDAAGGVLGNDVMRQKLMQDHAMASLENYRNGLRANAGLTNPNAGQYAEGVGMYGNILSPILSELGRASTPRPGISVSQDGTMNVNWG